MKTKLAPEDLLLRIATANETDLEKLAKTIRPKSRQPISEQTLALAMREAATDILIRNGIIERVNG